MTRYNRVKWQGYFRLLKCRSVNVVLVIKRNVAQNVNRMSENNISVCQYVRMLICQNATFQFRYQNEGCSKCHKDVRQSVCHYVYTSIRQYVNTLKYRIKGAHRIKWAHLYSDGNISKTVCPIYLKIDVLIVHIGHS